MKQIILKIHNIFLFFGFNVQKFLSLRFILKYFYQRFIYIKDGGKINKTQIELSDYNDQAGNAKGHYFHQDLLVANYIYEKNPETHLDIGSRIDGFVAHVASFRNILVMDIRDLKINIKNIEFIKQDLNKIKKNHYSLYESISCLHALEHFGLGRYGDPIDPNGHLKGFENLYKLLKKGGILYISFPIGANQTFFNSQRTFEPNEILKWCSDRFELIKFDYVNDDGNLILNASLDKLVNLSYGCGIYSLRKVK